MGRVIFGIFFTELPRMAANNFVVHLDAPHCQAHKSMCRRGYAAVVAAALALIAGWAAPAAAHARSPRAAPVTVSYVAQPGDTLYDMAARYLRDVRDWRAVAKLNRIDVPHRLRPGTSLRLPVALLRREPLVARIVAMCGPVARLFGNAPPMPAAVGMSFGEGDAISTGPDGFATVELADGSHLSLPPRSTVEFGTLRRTVLTETTVRVFKLKRGELDSEVTHAKHQDDRFEIRAPSIVAGVRGTRFRVQSDATAAEVEVLDGAVAVDAAGEKAQTHDASGASSQLVPARYGSVTRAAGGVGAPVALLAAPELTNPAKVQDGREVAFDLAPLADARAYRVQIARDAALLDLIHEAHVEAPHVAFADLPDGSYFVRISAIDANGLEGLPRVYAFERRENGLTASASRRAGSRDYEFRWLASRAGVATRFRFTLARSEDLREPVIDAVDLTAGHIVVANLPAGSYYWTVVAEQFENGRFYETAAGVRSFTLAR